jgi:hypothetical protein
VLKQEQIKQQPKIDKNKQKKAISALGGAERFYLVGFMSTVGANKAD